MIQPIKFAKLTHHRFVVNHHAKRCFHALPTHCLQDALTCAGVACNHHLIGGVDMGQIHLALTAHRLTDFFGGCGDKIRPPKLVGGDIRRDSPCFTNRIHRPCEACFEQIRGTKLGISSIGIAPNPHAPHHTAFTQAIPKGTLWRNFEHIAHDLCE